MTTAEDLDDYARTYYLADPLADHWLEERVQAWIAPHIASQCVGRTLEMGYGTGLMTRLLVEADVDLTVIEGSMDLVNVACTRHRDLPLIPKLFEEFCPDGHPDDVFDTVLCLHVLEHVDDVHAILCQMRGWVATGSRLIVVTPNATSLHRKVGALMTGDPPETLSDRDRLVGHRRVYDIEGLTAAVEAGPWEVVSPFGWFTKPVNNARMVDWPPELIDALCEIGWDSPMYDCANIGVICRAV